MDFTSWWPKKQKHEMVAFAKQLPPVGTKLFSNYRGKKYEALIVENKKSPQGRAIKMKEKVYYSMTAAAKAITRNQSGGWSFWTIIKKSKKVK